MHTGTKVTTGATTMSQMKMPEPVAWPLASKEESDMGWTLDYRFLEQVEKVASQRTDFTTSMEAAEQVLIAAAEMLRAPQPSDIGRSEPEVTTTQALITLGKVIAGYRPGEEGWSEYDQQAYDVAMSTPQPLSESEIPTDPAQETVNHATRIYNSGYMAGHQDTVEGCFTDILSADMETYHEDVVSELVDALRDHQPAEQYGH